MVGEEEEGYGARKGRPKDPARRRREEERHEGGQNGEQRARRAVEEVIENMEVDRRLTKGRGCWWE